ncbi:hypothetical protein CXP35_02105 [Komagataeibacter xylinus]|nr:hypothetical protein CXP35_02105 [Komagataeibacter xylinus]
MKLFSESSEKRRLFEKRRHPKTFILFEQCVVLKQFLRKSVFYRMWICEHRRGANHAGIATCRGCDIGSAPAL